MKRFIGKLLGAGAVVLAAAVVAACGGGNSSDSTPVAPPDAPVITSAIRGVSGTGTVTVTGTAQTGVTVTVTWPDNTDCDTAAAADGSWGCTSSAMTYALGQTVSAVAKNSLGTSRTVTAIIMGFTTSKLPDTGITADQCYQAGSNLPVSCTSTGALALNGLQDGNITPGATGMSYSSVGNYPITSCVKDNITGLIWEGKEASGLRAGGTLYTHYDSSFADSQDINAGSNSIGYVNYVNSIALCGYSDWRMPTVDELQSIVDYGVASTGPTINTTWFPNLPMSFWTIYWSSSVTADIGNFAWYIDFVDGQVSYGGILRSSRHYVRLVRASQ